MSLAIEQAPMTVADAAAAFGIEEWFRYQLDCFDEWEGRTLGNEHLPLEKMLVFYPTGKGKTKTTLTCMALRGVRTVVVLAPPITHSTWIEDGRRLGIHVEPMSHAKFRMSSTKLSRHTAVIVDEFHLLGGQGGQGWKKLDRMAAGMQAPLIICSATPNYNDAERVYCIAHVLDPFTNRGGYLAWLYQHCVTEPNAFGTTPNVTGFLAFPDAAAFLASLPGTVYLPDDAPDIMVDIPMGFDLPDEFDRYNLDMSRTRIMASQMERRHRKRFLQIVDPDTGLVREHAYEMLSTLVGNATTPTLVFAAHSEVAKALRENFLANGVSFGYIDGTTSMSQKDREVARFRNGEYDVLIGTASLATGTDGIDKMCDELVILDDTDDASLRRQLVGRVLPRGIVTPEDYVGKYAHRFVWND